MTISPEVKRKEYQTHVPVAQEWYEDRPIRTPARRKVVVQPAARPAEVPRLKLIDSDEFMQKTGETTGILCELCVSNKPFETIVGVPYDFVNLVNSF